VLRVIWVCAVDSIIQTIVYPRPPALEESETKTEDIGILRIEEVEAVGEGDEFSPGMAAKVEKSLIAPQTCRAFRCPITIKSSLRPAQPLRGTKPMVLDMRKVNLFYRTIDQQAMRAACCDR